MISCHFSRHFAHTDLFLQACFLVNAWKFAVAALGIKKGAQPSIGTVPGLEEATSMLLRVLMQPGSRPLHEPIKALLQASKCGSSPARPAHIRMKKRHIGCVHPTLWSHFDCRCQLITNAAWHANSPCTYSKFLILASPRASIYDMKQNMTYIELIVHARAATVPSNGRLSEPCGSLDPRADPV
jgi:hypothetical protein